MGNPIFPVCPKADVARIASLLQAATRAPCRAGNGGQLGVV
jgi:hypothetical protein